LIILLIACAVIILILLLTNYKTLSKIKAYANDSELDILLSSLPSNISICMEMQKMIGNECIIELDDKTKSSAYIFFLNKIILSNTEKFRNSYSRVLLIAHECIHSMQSRMTHILNFIFANVMILHDIYTLITLILGICTEEYIALAILLTFIHIYFRIILETDAVYRSMTLSDKYLENKGLDKVVDKYNEIVPATINGMYFMYLLPQLLKLELFISMFILI
jgi:hypothetical protein